MHLHRRHIRPQFDEHDPVRVLGIDMAIVRDAAGFGARAGGVFHAQRQRFGQMSGLYGRPAGDDDHPLGLALLFDLKSFSQSRQVEVGRVDRLTGSLDMPRFWTTIATAPILVLTIFAGGVGQAKPNRSAAVAPTPLPIPTRWHTEIRAWQQSWDYVADPERTGDGGWSERAWQKWFDPAQIPADLRASPLKTRTKLVMSFSASGIPEHCEVTAPSIDQRLDLLACTGMMAQAQIKTPYEAPGRPIAAKVNFSVSFSNIRQADWEAAQARPVAMVAPPPDISTLPSYSRWPRLKWTGGLAISAFPDLQAEYPVTAHGAEGVVSLDLKVTPATGAVECSIGVSSGSTALDAQSCEVGKKLPLAYPERCFPCHVRFIPLQFVWHRRKGSHIRVPLPARPRYGSRPEFANKHEPADPRTALVYIAVRVVLTPMSTDRLFDGIDPASITNSRPRLDLYVDVKGKVVGCGAGQSTGNNQLDVRLCARSMDDIRYAVIQDVFGDPAGSGDEKVFVYLRLAP